MPANKTRSGGGNQTSKKKKGSQKAKKHLGVSQQTKAQKGTKPKKPRQKPTTAQQQAKLLVQMAKIQRQAKIAQTARRSTRVKEKTSLAAPPSGVIGHYYTGKEFLKNPKHSVIHTEIETKVLLDLSANKTVLTPDVGCALEKGLEEAKKNSSNKDFIKHYTDSLGRTTLAVGRIAPDPEPDVKGVTPDPLSGINTSIDDRGHLVPEKGVSANAVTTANQAKNVVAENWLINQHYKKSMEDATKKFALANPNKVVQTMHEPRYNGNDLRPHQIAHVIIVDGKIVSGFTFENQNQVLETRPQ